MCSNTKYIAIGEDVHVIKGNLSWFMKEHIYIITRERRRRCFALHIVRFKMGKQFFYLCQKIRFFAIFLNGTAPNDNFKEPQFWLSK